jgi:IclR family acetate operon transcriptional repressor
MPARRNGRNGGGDVPAVARMLDLVGFLAERERPYGINELARALGLPVNSVFRILNCLQARGFVESPAPGAGYQLGTGFFSLGMRLHARFDLRRRARPRLEALARATGETAQVHVPDGRDLLVLDVAAPPAPFFLQVVPGTRLEYHAGAFGKAILAFLPEAEALRRLPRRLAAFTPRTITDPRAFRAELAAVRGTGLAYDREERVTGVYCIGAPVFDVNGAAVAGLGVTGLVSRFDAESRKRFEREVLACAEEVSRDIGYRGDRFERFRTAKPSAPRVKRPARKEAP